MRISACFLFAYIYERLNGVTRSQALQKFKTLSQDDTPMVRRGAAQSLAYLVQHLKNGDGDYQNIVEEFALPTLTALLKDENDSVKISAVASSVEVAKFIQDKSKVNAEIFPAFLEGMEKKTSWRLRFGIAEQAVSIAPHIPVADRDNAVINIYEKLLQDSEPEVRSEACNKLVDVAKNCSGDEICGKLLPICQTYIVSDKSPHVRGTLAEVICCIAETVGKERCNKFIVPVVLQLIQDNVTEVRVSLMENLEKLA